MTSENWVLSIIPSLLLLLLAWFARHQFGSWLFPSAFFGLYWALPLITSLILAPDFHFWPGAAWFILFFGWTVHVGTQLGWAIGNTNVKAIKRNSQARTFELFWGREILVTCTALGFLSVLITLQSRGYPLSMLLHPDLIPRVSRDFSIARYSEFYDPPLVARLLTAFVYLGSMIGGVWLGTGAEVPRRTRLLALLPFGPAGLLALIHTTRTSLLFPLIFFLATYFATLVLRQVNIGAGSVIRDPKKIAYASLLILAGVGIFIALQMLRDKLTLDDISITLDKTRVSLLGTPSAFSQWLEREWLNGRELGWGAYSFAGVYDVLGIAERQQGIYVEGAYVGAGEWSTNIYTVFRNLIDDFSLPCAIIVLFVIGVGAGFAHRKVSTGAYPSLFLLSLFYAFTLWSTVVSIFNYNSIILAWFIFFGYLRLGGLRLLRPVSSSRKREVVHDQCAPIARK